MSFNSVQATLNYRPSTDRDCDPQQFADRLDVCQSCEARSTNRCGLANQVVSVLARRKSSHCPKRSWPGETPLTLAALSPAPQTSIPLKKPVRLEVVDPDRPRVGIVYPIWQQIGGVEVHTRTLVEHCRNVYWTGLVALGPHHVDTGALHAMRKWLPAGGPELLQSVLKESTHLIVWGFSEPQPWLNEFTGKTISVAHGEGEWTARQLRTVRPFASDLVAVSELAATSYTEADRHQVKVIPNGIKFDRLSPTQTREVSRAEFGFGDKLAIAHVGRLSEEKNPLLAARAAKVMGPRALAVYVGDGHGGERWIAEAEKIAPGQVRWLGKMSDRLGDLYAAIDCLLIGSPAEGGPIVVAEAWVAHLPVVSTAVGVIPECELQAGQLTWDITHRPTNNELRFAIEQATGPAGRAVALKAARFAWENCGATRMSRRWEAEVFGVQEHHDRAARRLLSAVDK